MIKKDVAFSSPVFTVYATNAWDNGSRIGDQERLAFNDSSVLTKARVIISKSNERQISLNVSITLKDCMVIRNMLEQKMQANDLPYLTITQSQGPLFCCNDIAQVKLLHHCISKFLSLKDAALILYRVIC